MKFISAIALMFYTFCSSAQNRKVSFHPDTTINRTIKLLNATSIEKTFGDQRGQLVEDENPSRIQFTDATEQSSIILYHLDGGNANRFNVFEIGKVTSGMANPQKTTYPSFTTESGVHLGLTIDSLIRIKGSTFIKTIKGNTVTLHYRIKGEKNTFLKKYNMPLYEANYFFKEGILERFSMGFPNL